MGEHLVLVAASGQVVFHFFQDLVVCPAGDHAGVKVSVATTGGRVSLTGDRLFIEQDKATLRRFASVKMKSRSFHFGNCFPLDLNGGWIEQLINK